MPDFRCSYHFKKWQGEDRQDPHALPAVKPVKYQATRPSGGSRSCRSRDRVRNAASRIENWPHC